MDPIIFILAAALAVLGVLYLRSLAALRRVRGSLTYMADCLQDIAAGDSNRRLLTDGRGQCARLCYKINEIVTNYQDREATFKIATETNKRLMTSLSHDVRTPLTTLMGYLDAVHMGIVRGPEREEYMETARQRAHDMKDYIDVLFEWFKLNANEEVLAPEPCELSELTRGLLKDWLPVFEERKLDYDFAIPEQRLMVVLDRGGYARILNNLIQNVIAHSRATRLQIAVESENGMAQIRVEDNGVGIPPEDCKHIFERLYKCDTARTAKGSGLGLNIVQQLVEKLGGHITVESTPGVRTAFVVRFPLADG